MKKLILISALLLVAFDGWAYSETDLAKLKATNACEGCDLSEVNLRKANLGYANLTKTILKNTKLAGAKFCKTKIRREERNDHCED